jgi:hypothetical protein
MQEMIDAGPAFAGYSGGGETEKDAYRISEPDGDGNRFIIALRPDGRECPPSSDETGAFAREGA